MYVAQGGTTVFETPVNAASPIQSLVSLAAKAEAAFGGTWSVSVSSNYCLLLSSTGTSAWDAAFGGTTDTLTGFNATYSGVTSITAGSVASGGFYPYADDHSLLFALDERISTETGEQTFNGAIWYNTPGTNHRRPALSFSCLRAKSLEFVEAMDQIGTPAKVDIWDGETVKSFFLGNVRTSERNSIDGWTTFNMEIVR
jgi:hypothetical protein